MISKEKTGINELNLIININWSYFYTLYSSFTCIYLTSYQCDFCSVKFRKHFSMKIIVYLLNLNEIIIKINTFHSVKFRKLFSIKIIKNKYIKKKKNKKHTSKNYKIM